jgi:hypothetical protein
LEAYQRGTEILSAWTNWKNAQRIEEERSGSAKAEAALDAVTDELDPLVDQIIRSRAVTLDGLIAKARAAVHCSPPGAAAIDERIEDSLHIFGSDEYSHAFGMARDLIAMASSRRA